MQLFSCVTVASMVLLAMCSSTLAKPALPADSDLENDVVPHETQPALQLPSTDAPIISSSTAKVSSTTEAEKTDNRKPVASDFFSRLMDDIIQIPIAALRAVSQLLNNISARTRQAAQAAQAAHAGSSTTIAPLVTKS